MELRYYQEEAVQSLFDYFANHGGVDNQGKIIRANPLVALPTGTGKSVVITEFIKRAFHVYPSTRAFMATHVKELIKQNAKHMQESWPIAPLGIYSAGLNSRDIVQPIIFGGIQSCVGKYPLFGYRDFLIIDEAHLVSPNAETSYIKFIEELQQKNPYLKVIGLTATPYRMGLGRITNGQIFTHVCYDLTDINGFNRLIAEGYICPLIPKRTRVELDVSNVGINAGEFAQNQLEQAVDKNDINYAALKELVECSQGRKSWLIFASGIHHAEHLGDMLNGVFGIDTVVIHSKKTDKENQAALKAWKRGEVRAAVNMNALTTGVDHPPLDLIGMLRPTMSTGLWVQMLGRGTRPSNGKVNCLVLDFAGNTRRLGPINDPIIPRPKGQGTPGDAPVRVCPVCGVYNHASVRYCVACGTEFVFDPKLNRSASTLELLKSDLPQVEMFKVNHVVYSAHRSRTTGRSMIKASYYCGLRTFYEYVTLEDGGFAAKRGRDWFRQRYGEPWDTIDNEQVLDVVSQFVMPKYIRVWINKEYPEILKAEFE